MYHKCLTKGVFAQTFCSSFRGSIDAVLKHVLTNNTKQIEIWLMCQFNYTLSYEQ